jgi:transcriptional regulator with XRE-family HTH domain
MPNPSTAETFAANLRRRRIALGLSQADLGAQVRLSQAAVSRWESRKRHVSFEDMDRIAEALGMTAAELVTPPPDGREFQPDWCLAPAACLREWMQENGLRISTLAVAGAGRERRDEAAAMIAEVLDCKPLTAAHAALLARATFIPAGFWERFEANYRNGLAAGLTDTTPDDAEGSQP